MICALHMSDLKKNHQQTKWAWISSKVEYNDLLFALLSMTWATWQVPRRPFRPRPPLAYYLVWGSAPSASTAAFSVPIFYQMRVPSTNERQSVSYQITLLMEEVNYTYSHRPIEVIQGRIRCLCRSTHLFLICYMHQVGNKLHKNWNRKTRQKLLFSDILINTEPWSNNKIDLDLGPSVSPVFWRRRDNPRRRNTTTQQIPVGSIIYIIYIVCHQSSIERIH